MLNCKNQSSNPWRERDKSPGLSSGLSSDEVRLLSYLSHGREKKILSCLNHQREARAFQSTAHAVQNQIMSSASSLARSDSGDLTIVLVLAVVDHLSLVTWSRYISIKKKSKVSALFNCLYISVKWFHMCFVLQFQIICTSKSKSLFSFLGKGNFSWCIVQTFSWFLPLYLKKSGRGTRST